MTIAAGFVCRDSVLLCADTEHTGSVTKTHHAKIGEFEHPGGKIAFALAGNSAFAWAAIQKLKNRLEVAPPEKTIATVERVLEKEYRRNVLANPEHATDTNLSYQLLLAFWSPLAPVELYATYQTSMRKIDEFECIGYGGASGVFGTPRLLPPHNVE